METVVSHPSLGKDGACDKHHGRGQVQCYLLHLKPLMAGNLLDDSDDGLGLCAVYDGYQTTRSTVTVLVGQKRIDLTAAQAGFVYAQVRAHIFGIYQILRGVLPLFPLAEATEMFLVLGGEELAVYTVMVRYALDALGGALNPLLLKKPQTRD